MKIKKLSASFGKLSGDTLTLNSGLNIVHAPNESGKSTWCAFIRNMLYGVNTSDRDKAGYLSDKTRYRPWNGSAMEGSMDIEHSGRDITIQRTAKNKTPMGNFSAVYTGTSEPVQGLDASGAGEALTGVSESIFVRSAFISQSSVQINQAADLEKRMAAMVSTGEETGSFSEANERLKNRQKKIKSVRSTGEIPQAEAELSHIEENLSRLDSMSAALADMRSQRQRLTHKRAELEAALSQHDEYDAMQNTIRVRKSREDLDNALAAVRKLQDKLDKYPAVPTENELSSLRGKVEAYANTAKVLSDQEDMAKKAKASYDAALSAYEECKNSTAKNSPVPILVLFVIFAVCALVSLFIPAARPVLLPAAVITLIAGAVLFARQSVTHTKNTPALAAFENTLRSEEQTYTSLKSACESFKRTLEEIRRDIIQMTCVFSPDVQTPEEAVPVIEEIQSLKSQLHHAQSAAEVAKKIYDTVSSDAAADYDFKVVEAPAMSREQIRKSLAETDAGLYGLNAEYNMSLGEMQAIGDPLVLAGEKNELEEKLSALTLEYDAVTLAIETLNEAYTELQTRFSPALTKKAAEICAKLTDGRYTELSFDRSLNADAGADGDTVKHNVLSLSEGTADQIYLSLRLAICSLVLNGDDKCPIILDDALTNFDDRRAVLAIDYLKEISDERQVILFTCHEREGRYTAEKYGIEPIEL